MRKGLAFLILSIVFVAGFGLGNVLRPTPVAAQMGGRVFELRTYTASEGKLDALHARFRDHTLRIFQKHGMTNVGYWSPQDAPLAQNTLIYILAHSSREAAKKSWDAFRQDPDWQKAQKESEVNGRLTTKVESVFMNATDYSPMK
ncbi:MAG: NIPSNAP family protein [Acidobacteria bacterium]|nr:NIPSNAP family protein [Acidobacteriota bacterium]MBI3261547.1 NIPSNAP family protein [Acidobacteriota bacterium]